MRKSLPKHWYYTFFGCCLVCGSDKTYKERRIGDRPNPGGVGITFEYQPDIQTYDGCEL